MNHLKQSLSQLEKALRSRPAWYEPLEEEAAVVRYRGMLPKRYQRCTLENFEGDKRVVKLLERWEAKSFIYLWGAPGVGKTHLAVALGYRLLAKGTVRYINEVELLSQLRGAAIGGEPLRLPDPDVLILDDLGKARPSEYAYQELYRLIERHWSEERCLIVTSNYRPSEAANRIAPDEMGAAAILSRLASGLVLEIKGIDQRLKTKMQ